MRKYAFVCVLGVVGAPRAWAEPIVVDPYGDAWFEPHMASEIGVSTVIGAGITGFTDSRMRDVTPNVNGLWDLRVTIGSHIPLALDLGYVGTASSINAPTGPQEGTLVGTAVEGALRFNLLPHYAWNPYVFAGVGWQHYTVTDAEMTLVGSGMNDEDSSVVFPMGVGLVWRDHSGFVADAHATFRANTNYGLVLDTPEGGSFVPMHYWEASVAAGYEF